MMYMLLMMLVSILAIGFMRGSFIALLVTVSSAIVGYLGGMYFATGIVVLVTIGVAIYKYKN